MNGTRLSALSTMLLAFSVAANACEPGETMTVIAIPHLSCHAGNTESCNDHAKWNPEPGWVIRQARTIVHTANNSGKSVSVVAGGSAFLSRHQVESAHASAVDAGAQSGDKEYRAKLTQAYNSYLSMYDATVASHNTIEARINAKGTGLFQEGAWIDISVEADVVCLGSSGDVNAIRDHLLKEAGLILPAAKEAIAAPASDNFSWSSAEGSHVIKKEGVNWHEYAPSGQIAYQFVEQRRDGGFIYILDSSRSFEMALPIGGGQSSIRWSGSGGQWQGWHSMTPG